MAAQQQETWAEAPVVRWVEGLTRAVDALDAIADLPMPTDMVGDACHARSVLEDLIREALADVVSAGARLAPPALRVVPEPKRSPWARPDESAIETRTLPLKPAPRWRSESGEVWWP